MKISNQLLLMWYGRNFSSGTWTFPVSFSNTDYAICPPMTIHNVAGTVTTKNVAYVNIRYEKQVFTLQSLIVMGY